MEFPSKCPYCGKDIVPNSNLRISELDNFCPDFGEYGLALEIHKCIHCQKTIFVVQNEYKQGKSYYNPEIIFYYPTVTTVDFPKRIKKLSPNAYKTYEQTIQAKEHNFDMLVGAGLRIALEWLVWDYLIKIQGKTDDELEKLSLRERIKLMSSNFYTEVCTRLVRLFGNDSVHIVKQLDFSVEEVIKIFQLLCSLIDSELQILETNDKLKGKK